ncbi:hypothetical protein B0P06_001278 [Clostridium saccharoperbutylacetonicum]|uniref:Uncharacterized protein n=1 Tax=Clostridium saccharoperbutylacetonicum N1-4(HMT) TaxID=931276 RepID=M1MIE6_9CLOT|nr:hypothetical protein [Clostridium saccharoperbutylacetonicum]AGF54646.1 hypothetical protein Cspa_c08690 [Clostridium saccharoperbutylacetonicum N1-4(HMT)]NRT58833.1 hypothetical protein [Clostridium saccharoperbutylacetonicum]NSB28022.1 hypothetical protein [Clostridium saccharoperbutylacetonicum]NSB41507.1 hypothetical protein [Clostridium saccharoperbutylacetonicum]
MLGKLMKYEIKATGRTLIPLYIALLVLATIIKFFIGTGLSEKLEGWGALPFILSIFAYGCTMAAVVIVTLFIIIQRFYKNLLGDEGYLMNTLPVSTTTNIASKLSIAVFWNIIGGLVAILSIIIMAFNPTVFGDFFSEISKAFSEISAEIGVHVFAFIVEFIVLALLSMSSSIAMIYSSISIGHLFSKHRILLSFCAFIALSIISGIITQLLGTAASYTNLSTLLHNIHSPYPVHMMLLLGILYNLLFLIAYFIIPNYILKNKLNLE